MQEAQAGGTQEQRRLPASKTTVPDIGPEVTTLVLFNIPWNYTTQELLDEWEIGGKFDYLNVLYNFECRHNVGYAFLNFTKNSHAVEFAHRWHGHCLARQKPNKPLQTVPARKQGLMVNLAHLSAEDLQQMAAFGVLPVVFLDGVRVDAREASLRLGLGGGPDAARGTGTARSSSGADGDSGSVAQVAPVVASVPLPSFVRGTDDFETLSL